MTLVRIVQPMNALLQASLALLLLLPLVSFDARAQTTKRGNAESATDANKERPRVRQQARQAPVDTEATFKDRLNENTVTIVTGSPSGTYMSIGSDMANVLDAGHDLRLLVIAGKGSVQNIKDVLYLRGVDLGIIQSDVLTYFKGTGELGPRIESRLVYLSRLYNEEFHIIARSDVSDLKQLTGKAVNFAPAGSGSQASARVLFKALGVDVKEVNMPQADALLKLQSGEISATLEVVGKPFGLLQKFVNDGKDGAKLRLLPIPFVQALESDYVPARLSHEDYPNLIAAGGTVDTISVSSVLAAYNWPRGTDRHRRLQKFSLALMEKFEDLKKPPRHPKWRDVNLAAEVGGWQRFEPVKEWLDEKAATEKKAAPALSTSEWLKAASAAAPGGKQDAAQFERFVSEAGNPPAPTTPEAERALFEKFLAWSRARRNQ